MTPVYKVGDLVWKRPYEDQTMYEVAAVNVEANGTVSYNLILPQYDYYVSETRLKKAVP
jgi:hypothetical protein